MISLSMLMCLVCLSLRGTMSLTNMISIEASNRLFRVVLYEHSMNGTCVVTLEKLKRKIKITEIVKYG